MTGGGGSGGGNTSSTTTTSGPPAPVLQAYQSLVNAATTQSQQPLQQYTAPIVAGFTPQQQAGFQDISNASGIGIPYTNAAAQEFGKATTPLWSGLPSFDTSSLPTAGIGAYGSATGAVGNALGTANNLSVPGYDTLSTYTNPYTAQVTDATRRLFDQQNATRSAQIAGDATSQHAYGGDREAVAQALAAQQENLAQAPVLAGIQQSGFQQQQQELNQQQALALQRQQAQGQMQLGAGQAFAGLGQGQFGEFNTQQQQKLAADQANAWLASQAAFGMGALGTQAQTQALQGAQAELGAGALQQQLAQSQLNIPYQQFLQTQAYPYQQLGFLAPIVEGTGSLSGGIGKTTSPGPSTLSQLAGLGLAGAGAAGGLGLFNGSGPDTSGGITDFGGGGDLSNVGDFGFPGQSRGGRIGYADGGMTTPEIPGIGQGVPTIDLSYIPEQNGMGVPSKMGLSPFENITNTTQSQSSGGGGSSALSGIGTAVSIASKVIPFFLARGGNVPRGTFDDGGMVGIGDTRSGNPGRVSSFGALPKVPTINLDYIVAPGPAVKGSGPPKPPSPAPEQNPIKDSMGALGQMKDIKGMFGKNDSSSSDTSSSDYSGNAIGGRIGFDAGGATGGMGSAPIGAAIAFGGAPPSTQQSYQQLLELPMDRLQQMAVQFPPNSQQGQLVARALAAKKMTPGAGTAPVTPPPNTGGGTGVLGMPVGTGSGTGTATSPQDYGGTSHLAIGGQPGYVTEDELDPHPIVDHSGDTVKIRYPSEGKVLDLGLPPIRDDERGHFPTGGTVDAPTQMSTAAADTTFFTAPNGVAIPQLQSHEAPLTGPNTPTGGGLGSHWFEPLPQHENPGFGFFKGPGGTTMFPSSVAYTPQMAGLIGAFSPGATLPVWAGGQAPSSGGGGSSGGDSMSQSISTPITQIDPSTEIGFSNLIPGGDTSGGKRGGRIGFADGGDTDEFGMEDYAPTPTRSFGIRTKIPGDPLGLSTKWGAPVFAADLPSDRVVAHADIPPLPVDKGAYADLPPPIEDRGAHADIPPVPRDKGAYAAIPLPEGDFGAGGFGQEPRRSAERGAPLWDAPEPPPPSSGFAGPAYRAIPELIATGDLGGFVSKPSYGPAADVEPQTSQSMFIPKPEEGPSSDTPSANGGIGAVKPSSGGLGDAGYEAGTEDYVSPSGLGAPPPTVEAPPEREPGSRIGAGVSIPRVQPVAQPVAVMPPATTQSATPSTRGFDMGAGDSIGVGFIRAGGLGGTAVNDVRMPDAALADAAGSRNPQQALDFIKTHPERFRGKSVLWSSGLMNSTNPATDLGVVGEQLDALKASGANVVLAGVDQGKFAAYNAGLKQLADARGIPFAGALPTNNVHPGPQGYRDYSANAAKLLQSGAPPPDADRVLAAPGSTNATTGWSFAPGTGSQAAPTGGPDQVQPARALGPVAQGLVQEAQRQGVPESLVLKAGQIESGMGANLGTRGNVLQLGPREWQQAGGGDMNDPATQYRNGVAWLKKSRDEAQQALGREPQDWEAYVVHQQGAAGGPALLNAAPGTSAVDALTPAHGGNRQEAMQAIVANGGDLGMSASQFLDSIKNRFEGFGARQNLGSSLNLAGRSGAPGAATGPVDPLVGAQTPPKTDPATTREVANKVLATTPPEHRSAMAQWMNSPWFPVFLAGAGMLASRSPFPGVALGEGLLTAGKGVETAAGLQNKAELAEARLGTLQANADAKTQHADYLNRSLAERTANATATRQLHEAVAASQEAARVANAQWREANFHLATIKVQLGEFNPPQYVERPDPTDPTKKIGGMWYSPKLPDASKPDGGGMFIPGAGGTKPVAVTGAEIGIQDLIQKGLAKDRLDAEAQIAAAKRDPRSAQSQALYGHLVQSKENEMLHAWQIANQMNPNAKPPNFRAQAEAAVSATLGHAPGTAAPAAQAGAPAKTAAPVAAPAQSAAPAAMPQAMPAWAAPGSPIAYDPSHNPVFKKSDGKWYYGDERPYAP